MVYDLGGGNSDVSIIEMGDSAKFWQPQGKQPLGGDDSIGMDWMDFIQGGKRNKVDVSGDKMAVKVSRKLQRRPKIDFSGMTSLINLPFITSGYQRPKHLDLTLSRVKVQRTDFRSGRKTMGPVRQALSDSGLKIGQIDKALPGGWFPVIPAVQEAVKKLSAKIVQG